MSRSAELSLRKLCTLATSYTWPCARCLSRNFFLLSMDKSPGTRRLMLMVALGSGVPGQSGGISVPLHLVCRQLVFGSDLRFWAKYRLKPRWLRDIGRVPTILQRGSLSQLRLLTAPGLWAWPARTASWSLLTCSSRGGGLCASWHEAR